MTNILVCDDDKAVSYTHLDVYKRQGVHDLVRRCDRTLQSYEERLHLIARFQKVKHTVEKIEQISTETQVRELAGQILEEL